MSECRLIGALCMFKRLPRGIVIEGKCWGQETERLEWERGEAKRQKQGGGAGYGLLDARAASHMEK